MIFPASPKPHTLRKTSAFAAAWHRLSRRTPVRALTQLPKIAVEASAIQTLESAKAYRETLLTLIAQAKQRILIAALYVEDDEAGREILLALYAAQQATPSLEICIFVDWHRAQRGLIGKSHSSGNAAIYRTLAQQFAHTAGNEKGVEIYGVPVQTRELMGVLHLKGFVIDDAVLYSGASLNAVYLHKHERYRLDRYHLIRSAPLADSLGDFLLHILRAHPAVQLLNTRHTPKTSSLRSAIKKLRRVLSTSTYVVPATDAPLDLKNSEVGITPLLGLGTRGNELNSTLLNLVQRAEHRLVLLTPYFNLPGVLRKEIVRRLRLGCKVIIIIGDKTANDFFIPPTEPFKAIGVLPYLYEVNLRRFCKAQQKAIKQGLLEIHLWQHQGHSFHLKGLLIDDDYALLTGNNLNPRAWRLDLENGLLIHDPHQQLIAQHLAELDALMAHTRRIDDFNQLDTLDAYPAPVQRLLKRLGRTRTDRLLNQVL